MVEVEVEVLLRSDGAGPPAPTCEAGRIYPLIRGLSLQMTPYSAEA